MDPAVDPTVTRRRPINCGEDLRVYLWIALSQSILELGNNAGASNVHVLNHCGPAYAQEDRKKIMHG